MSDTTKVDRVVDYGSSLIFTKATTKHAGVGAVRFDAPVEVVERYAAAAEVVAECEALLEALCVEEIQRRRAR